MKTTSLSVSDLTAIIDALRQMQDSGIEWEDANELYRHFVQTLDKQINIRVDVLEKALWAVTMVHEEGKFKHLYKMRCDHFINRVTPEGYKFNRETCIFEKKND